MFGQGDFFIGANYWASHAGTNMWKWWDEGVVDADFERLSKAGIEVLRVFPLWPDFQPLRMHYGGNARPRELRMGEDPLPDTEAGRAGVDESMVQRFTRLCELAEAHGLRLIVGLLTGWMSGRMYFPEFLIGQNLITSPEALACETRYVRFLVRALRDQRAVIAWDLGNECNVMGHVASREEAYVWTSLISLSIRVEDASRPILSGMHSLSPEGVWTPRDQGDLLDVLCTHPYPLWTPHCGTDPIDSMKSSMHAAAESRMYADLSGKPCFVEEVNSLGPMFGDDDTAARYVRGMLFQAWSHDARGVMWWCANDQSHLKQTPYDWDTVERELGLFRLDGTPKPALGELARFGEFLRSLPFATLPSAITDAVCVLTRDQDAWGAAYGAFMLAKQAGLNLRFTWHEDEIPDAPAYLLPSLKGGGPISRRKLHALAERVRAGATLYLSSDGGLMDMFRELTGLIVTGREAHPTACEVEIAGERAQLSSDVRYALREDGARVLARDEKGAPAFAVHSYGNGRVYYLNYPLEQLAAERPGAIEGADAQPYARFYRALSIASSDRVAQCDVPGVTFTEHIVGEGDHILALTGCLPGRKGAEIRLKSGWRMAAFYAYGEARLTNRGEDGAHPFVEFADHAGAVLRLAREANA